jgi:hypothetical protein
VCVFATTQQRSTLVVVSECQSRVFVVGAPWVVFDEPWYLFLPYVFYCSIHDVDILCIQ